MQFDFDSLPAVDRYKLLVSTITPRPIAWVVSENHDGKRNTAPFSFFNAFAGDPPIVGIGIGSHRPGRFKDTWVNIEATRQFVVNLVAVENATAMNATAVDFDYGTDELTEAGLTPVPSLKVKPPRIAESPVSFECELFQAIELGAANRLVLGRVLMMHIRDELILDVSKHYVDTPKLRLIGRMHGTGWYARTTDLFQMPRIPLAEWRKKDR
jgi:flavin reductase (DIM6/NTAB) family NADH-FMN oxidoreductase RutF